MPPAPTRYFNDYAGVVRPATVQQLNTRLESFEKESSSQIWVVIFPKMQSDSSVADYTQRVADSWKVGLKGKDNGAVLFVFVNDRQMFLQVGRGLEGVIPDAIAKRITEDVIKPHFRTGDYDGGLTVGVNAIIQAARGEFKGTGRTVAQNLRARHLPWPTIIFFAIFFIFIARSFRRRGTIYGRRGYSSGGGWFMGGGGWGSGGGGGWSSGGSSGGFASGGGGSFGGGGAGSSW